MLEQCAIESIAIHDLINTPDCDTKDFHKAYDAFHSKWIKQVDATANIMQINGGIMGVHDEEIKNLSQRREMNTYRLTFDVYAAMSRKKANSSWYIYHRDVHMHFDFVTNTNARGLTDRKIHQVMFDPEASEMMILYFDKFKLNYVVISYEQFSLVCK